jgi:TRAP-type C4-dicarboxylate transport system permease small subunit
MRWVLAAVPRLSNVLYVIAGVTLTAMMLITVADVILRYLGKPIVGSYELVSFGAAVVIGFALPATSLAKSHVVVDILTADLTGWKKILVSVFTRTLGIFLFAGTGIFLFKKALYMHSTGEVSLTLQMPFYPIAYGLGVCCLVECLVLMRDIAVERGGKHG